MSDVSISSSDSENSDPADSAHDGLMGALAKKLSKLKKNQTPAIDGSHCKAGGSGVFSEHSSSSSNIGRPLEVVTNIFNKKDEVTIDRVKRKPYKIQPKITFHLSKTRNPGQPKVGNKGFMNNKYISVFRDSIMTLGRMSMTSAPGLNIPGRRDSRAFTPQKMTQEYKRQLYNQGNLPGGASAFKAPQSIDGRSSMREGHAHESQAMSSSEGSSSSSSIMDSSIKAPRPKIDTTPMPEDFGGNLLGQPNIRDPRKAKITDPLESLNIRVLRNKIQANGSAYAIPKSATGNVRPIGHPKSAMGNQPPIGHQDSLNSGQRESWTVHSTMDSQLGTLPGGTPGYRNNAFFRRTDTYRNQMYPGRQQFQETAAERLNSTSKIDENLKKNPFRIEITTGGGKKARPYIPGLVDLTPKSDGSKFGAVSLTKFGISPMGSRISTGGAYARNSNNQSNLNPSRDSKPPHISNFFGKKMIPNKDFDDRSSVGSRGSKKYKKAVSIKHEDKIKINLYNLDDSIKKKKSVDQNNETNLLRKIKDSVKRSNLFAPKLDEDQQKSKKHDNEDFIEKFSEKNIIYRRDSVNPFTHKRSTTGPSGRTLDVKLPISKYKEMLDEIDNDEDDLFVNSQAKVGIPKVISEINDLDLTNRGIKLSAAYDNYDNYVNLALNK